MALDQQARLFPDRQVHWRQHARHALLAQPALGGGDQRTGNLLCLGLQRAPIAGARPHALFHGLGEREFIDMCRNAPDDPPGVTREEQLHAGVFMEGVAAGGEFFQLFGAQLWHKIGVGSVRGIDIVHPRGAFGLGRNRRDGEGGHV